MATLLAVDITDSIDYGSLALNATTADTTAFDTIVTNTGNSATVGVQVKSDASTAMSCDIGTIPVGNERYHAASATPYTSKTALKATDETVAGVSAAKTTDGLTGDEDTVSWGLQMPVSGVGGTCSGTVVFTAIAP